MSMTIAVLAATGIFFVRNTWWDADDVPTLQFTIAHGQGFEGTDEYDPVGDDHYNLPTKIPQPRAVILSVRDGLPVPDAASVFVERWTAEEKIIRVVSPEPARLALRLLNYPAWKIQVNDSTISPEQPTDTNQMMLPISSGQSTIRVRFTRTLDRTLGLLLSLLSALLAVALLAVAHFHSSVDNANMGEISVQP